MRIFSYGGGVQSTASLVLAAQREIDFPVFLFANVGDDSEHPATLRYVREVAMPYAEEKSISLYEIRRYKKTGETETLYGRMMRPDSRSLPIPVRMSNGAPGTRACTVDFKISVIAKYQKGFGATAANPAITGLGISVDEIERARTDSGIAWQTLEYPLLELGLTRKDCVRIIERAGLPVPPKSSCWFCPYHTRNNWKEMKRTDPELFQRAIELEVILNQRRDTLGKDHVYLHPSLTPLSQAVGDQLPLFDDPNDMFCGSSCMT